MARTEAAAAVAFAAALEFERGCYARAAAQSAPHALGLAVRDRAVPRAHVANMLWVTAATVTAPELLEAVEETQGGLGHRKVQVDDDELGAVLVAPMRAAGYLAEHHIVMVRRRPPDRAPRHGSAAEVDALAHAAVDAAVTREYPHGKDEEVVEQLTRARSAIHRAAPGGTRFFVGTADGVPAASATLLTGDGVAQLEDVATLQAHRGRGLGRAVCSLALGAAAETALVFLVADADDWPRTLYAKLGFDRVGAFWAFVRDPA